MADSGSSVSKTKAGKRQKKSAPLSLTEAQPGPSKQVSIRDKECPERSKGSKASERNEHRRDKVLQKICAQSMSKAASSSSKRAGGDNSTQPSKDHPQGPLGDQLSLDNPDLAINNPDIWGTAGFDRQPEVPSSMA